MPIQRLTEGSLHDAIQETLAESELPTDHGFATIVDLNGAHVALATKVGKGWRLEASGGYNWSGDSKGANGKFVVGKSW